MHSTDIRGILPITYSTSRAVDNLPEDYHDLHIHPPASPDHEEAARYGELRERLAALCKRRDEQRQRLVEYQHLQSLLRPFDNAQENIQPNLVTKDGELGKELDRTRILLARVSGRVAEIKNSGVAGEQGLEATQSNKERLAKVLELI